MVASGASGSAAFSLSAPAAYQGKAGLELVGRVGRRARSTQLTPASVRIERLGPTGEIVASARAYLHPIGRRTDQRCASYLANVDWRLAPGDTLRACFDRGRACSDGVPSAPTVVTPIPQTAPS